MLKQMVYDGEQRPIHFLYGVPNENEIIFQDTFDDAGVHVTVVVDQPSASWGGERGQITIEKVVGLEAPTTDSLIYVSGPEPMVEDLTKRLRAHGFGQNQVISDYVANYTGI
jgi:NAD(P)H-flavin reductase